MQKLLKTQKKSKKAGFSEAKPRLRAVIGAEDKDET